MAFIIWGQVVSLLELGGLNFFMEDFQSCQKNCEDGLALAEQSGDLETIAHLFTGLSIVHRQLGDQEQSGFYVLRSLDIYEKLDQPYGLIQGSLTLGTLLLTQGQQVQAQSHFELALHLSQQIGFRSGEADSHHRLGQIAVAVNDLLSAKEHQYAALELAAATQEIPLLFDVLFEIAGILSRTVTENEAALVLAWLQRQPEVGSHRLNEIADILAGYPGRISA